LRYELITPSDPITFEAEDHQIAALVAFVLGHGAYGAEPEDAAAETVPPMPFGGADEWWYSRFDEPLKGAGDRHASALATALRSLRYDDFAVRQKQDRELSDITDADRRATLITYWND